MPKVLFAVERRDGIIMGGIYTIRDKGTSMLTQEQLRSMTIEQLFAELKKAQWIQRELKARKGQDCTDFILAHGYSSDMACEKHPVFAKRRAELRKKSMPTTA
jgi:hypothetical protein